MRKKDGVIRKLYWGDHRPREIKVNNQHYSGCVAEIQNGVQSASFEDTYNDTADVVVKGNTVQLSDWYAKEGLSTQEQISMTNLSINGAFADASSWNGWNVTPSVPTAGECVCTIGSPAFDNGIWEDITGAVGHVFYFSFECYPKYATTLVAGFSGNIGAWKSDGIVANEWNRYSCIVTQGTNNRIFFGHGTNTGGYVAGDIFKIRNIMVCDLTALSLTLKDIATLDAYTATHFTGTKVVCPSPDAPSPIVSNLAAGTYKYTSTDGIYEFTLTEELRGINTTVDKIVFDRKSHRGILEKRVGKYVFTGTETYASSWLPTVVVVISYLYDLTKTGNTTKPIVCSHLTSPSGIRFSNNTGSYFGLDNAYATFNVSTIADLKAKIVAAYTTSSPIYILYCLKNPQKTPLTFTKVSSSSATEVPMTFLTSTPSLDYPAQVYDVSGNVLVNGEIKAQLPTLRKVGTVQDEYNPKTGKKLKKISDWVTLDGSKSWFHSGFNGDYKEARLFISNGKRDCAKVFKHTSEELPSSALAATNGGDSQYMTEYTTYIRAKNTDSGFSSALNPSTEEWKAYFYGWKMCNADGTSPYYKSEVPYTPSTWAEWTKDSGVTADSTGMEIVADGVNYIDVKIPMTFKASTKYGILYNTLNSSLTNDFCLRSGDANDAFSQVWLSKNVGNSKNIITTNSTLTATLLWMYIQPQEAAGNSIKIKDFRVFELPTGSQIESDFNTLTADQLAAKYPFNGLCVKNWKHVTDGLGQTATLPTASYDGYTPYKMCYQLATPVEEQYTPSPVPTYYPTTIIETDCVNSIPTMDITLKVEE